MTAIDEIIEHGIDLVHSGRCPACDMGGNDVALDRAQPDGFHYHGQVFVDPPYLWCAVDGQGYRIVNDELRIMPPCNGGLHTDGTVGFR